MTDLFQRVIGSKLSAVLQSAPNRSSQADDVIGVSTIARLDNGLIVELAYEQIELVAPERILKLIPAEFKGNYPQDPGPRLIIGEKVVAVLHSGYWATAGLLLENGYVLHSFMDCTRVTWVGPYVGEIWASDFEEYALLPDMAPLTSRPDLVKIALLQK